MPMSLKNEAAAQLDVVARRLERRDRLAERLDDVVLAAPRRGLLRTSALCSLTTPISDRTP
jgi:hypothetical protein